MSTINFRIEKLVKHFSNGNNSDFGLKIGVNEANIRNYISGTEPKFNILEKIVNNFEINFEWLLTGRGPMLKEEKESIYSQKEDILHVNEEANTYHKSKKTCDELREEVYQLKEDKMALIQENKALMQDKMALMQDKIALIENKSSLKEENTALKHKLKELETLKKTIPSQ